MLMRWIKPLIWVLLNLLPAIVFAQEPDIVFHHLTEKEGLSYNIINCFLKDRDGMLWIGTYNGLNRYDGAHFYIFKQTRDSNSITHNTVHTLCEDRNGNIWGGTDAGIFFYDKKRNVFKRYPAAKKGVTTNIWNMLCDKDGDIWATGNLGLMYYMAAKDSFVTYTYNAEDKFSISHSVTNKNGLLGDASGKGLWVATRRGLNYFDKEQKRFINYRNNSDSVVFNNHEASALCASEKGFFWYCDNHSQKIIRVNSLTMKTVLIIDMKGAEPDAATLFEDKSNTLWFSSWSYELARINYKDSVRWQPIRHDERNPTSVAGDFFWSAREDADGTIWLGTVGGISKYNSQKAFYKVHRLSDQLPFLKDNYAVSNLAEDSTDRTWWVGTNQQKLIHYFPSTGRCVVYDLRQWPKNKLSQQPGYIQSIKRLAGKLLVFTSTGAWNWNGNSFQPYEFLPAPFDKYVVKGMMQQDDSVYWVSDGFSIIKWNDRSGSSRLFDFAADSMYLGRRLTTSWMRLRNGNVPWMVSGIDVISYVDEAKGRIIPVKLQVENQKDHIGYFHSFDIDGNGLIWFSYKGDGLYRYDPVSGKLENFRETEGLIFDHIMTSRVDKYNQVWCAAYNKVSVYVPSAGNFYNFSLPLSSGNYGYLNSTTTLSDGNVVANIQGDLVEFFSQRIVSKPVVDKPLISAIEVSGRNIFVGNDSVIQLEPDENFLTIRFGMITDPDIFPYSFEYMLQGLDKTWVAHGTGNEAVYTDLPPGRYKFRLLARARNKSWVTEERVLEIVIRTPFYRSVGFIAGIILLLAAGLFAFYRYRISQKDKMMLLESKAQHLEKEKALVMYENLKQHLNPHFLFNSLTSLSSLIRLDQKMAGDFLDKMSKVYRYILKNRDNETVPVNEELKFVDLYIQLQKTRFGEGLQIDINIDEDSLSRKIAPVTLQNLVENAIKHNTSDAESPLRIELYTENDYLVVRNNLQRKNFVETSNKQGLNNMVSLYHYLSEIPMIIEEDPSYFTVKIPLI